ncbi:hypothetical protein BGX38DRAFT_1329994 [Terfezia claveryi]|nr:hypothetical protein BGX38DRAFT_1329994 [Terfezia claveryi]
MSQSSFSTEEPTQASQLSTSTELTVQAIETKKKRVHYIPELKLLLIRLCAEHQERYLEEPTELASWQLITALFKEMTVTPAVSLPPTTALKQAIDFWIETCERRNELRGTAKAEGSAEVKREKAISEALRDNLTKHLSKKRDFQAVVEAHEVVDLTAPGNVPQKRRQIRENLRANTNNTGSKDKMREDFSKLTDVFINYMRKPSKCSCSKTANQAPPRPPNRTHPRPPNWPQRLHIIKKKSLVLKPIKQLQL